MKKIRTMANAMNKVISFATNKIILIMILIGLMVPTSSLKAQLPNIDWQKNWQWNSLSGASLSTNPGKSGEDWLYSIKKRYNTTGGQAGYVVAGYGGYEVQGTTEIETAAGLFNEGSTSYFQTPYWDNFGDNNHDGTCEVRDAHGLNNVYNREMYVGTLELRDLSGNLPTTPIWAASTLALANQLALTVGEIDEVVQSTNKVFYYVVGMHIGITSLVKRLNPSANASLNTYLKYNPTSSSSTDNFYNIQADPTISTAALTYPYGGASYAAVQDTFHADNGHCYIAKIRASDGKVMWENLYGAYNFSASSIAGQLAVSSFGGGTSSDIIQSTDAGHNLYVATNYFSWIDGWWGALALQIDTNGYVLNKRVFVIGGQGRGICQVGSGRYAFVTNANQLFLLNSNLNDNTTDWVTSGNPLYFSTGANMWDLEYLPSTNTIIAPFIEACPTGCVVSGNLGTIYGINASDGTISFSAPITNTNKPIYAVDTRIKVTPTNDGGFAAVTTIRDGTLAYSNDFSFLQSPYNNCPTSDPDQYDISGVGYDTDALLAKYDGSGNMQWSASFDRDAGYPGTGRTVYPAGDLRHSECMFAITQADDGSILVGGKDSHNGEDYYLTKMLPECNSSLATANVSVGTYTVGTTTGFTSAIQNWTAASNPFKNIYNALNPSAQVASVSTVYVTDKLVVPAGYAVTTSGITFKFRPRTGSVTNGNIVYGARVIIKNTTIGVNGGSLTLNANSLLTTDTRCNTGMWEGVEVWGDGATAQTLTGPQGNLKLLSSSAKIEKAYIGALIGKRNVDFSVDAGNGSGGGYIYCSTGKFWDNQYDVEFFPYSIGANLSNFLTTEFKNTLNISALGSDAPPPLAHVYLRNTKGIVFRGCSMINAVATYNIANVNQPLGYVTGIFAEESEFFCRAIVSGTGVVTQVNTFNHLQYGVYATWGATVGTVTIDRCNFANGNFKGVYLHNATLSPTIIRNTFSCYPVAANTTSTDSYGYGIYLDVCQGYTVQENTIFSSTPTNKVIGIIVNGGNTSIGLTPAIVDQKIYKNTIYNVWNGIQSQGINYIYYSIPNNRNDDGVKFLCNTFRPTGTTITGKIGQLDMGIMYNTTTMIYSGINFHQQDVDALSAPIGAGNMFSYGGTSVKYDYFSHGVGNISKIRYDYDGGTGRIPLVYTGSAVTTFSQSVNGCNLNPLPAFGVTNTTSYYKNRLSTLLLKMDSVKQLLSDSDGLLSYFNDTVPASTLKDSLTAYSPYLSDSLLISTIKDTNVLSKNDIADVVIANSPLRQKIKDTLNTIAMSYTLRALIDSAQTGTSARENAEDVFSNLRFEKNMIQNDILRSELNKVDTLAMPDDSIINDIYEFVESGNTVNKDDMLAYYYAERGDYAHTDSIINYLNSTYENENLAKLIEVYKNLKQNGKNIYNIASDTALQQLIMQVVGDSTRRGYDKAIALLQEVFSIRHHEIIEDIQGDESKSMILKPAKENSTSSNAFINCYPNPASQLISFSYQLPSGASQGIIAIYNCFGQNIKNITVANIQGIESVNLDKESNGLYFYTLIVNSTTIARNKFVINK